MKTIIENLHIRYITMSLSTPIESRVKDMMDTILDNVNTWPVDKTNRWLGYTQALIIEVGQLSTIERERDYTRPLFHDYYNRTNQPTPESVTAKSKCNCGYDTCVECYGHIRYDT